MIRSLRWLSIRGRLTVGLVLVASGVGVIAAVAHRALAAMDAATTSLVAAAELQTAVGDARTASLGVRRFEKDFIINAGAPAAQARYTGEWRDERKLLEESLAQLEHHCASDAERAELSQAQQAVARYGAGIEAMMAAARPGLGASDLNRLVAPVKNEIRSVIALMDRLAERQAAEVRDQSTAARTTHLRTRRSLGLMTAVVLLAAALVGGGVALSVKRATLALTGEAAGIQQLGRAAAALDKVVQQNAASAEESSSATSELNGQAEELSAMVATFRVDRTAVGRRPDGQAALPARGHLRPAASRRVGAQQRV